MKRALDKAIVQVLAVFPDGITAYEITSKVYPDDRYEALSQKQSAMRYRLNKLIAEGIVRRVVEDKIALYSLVPEASLVPGIIMVPDAAAIYEMDPDADTDDIPMVAYEVGDVLIIESEEAPTCIVLDSWA